MRLFDYTAHTEAQHHIDTGRELVGSANAGHDIVAGGIDWDNGSVEDLLTAVLMQGFKTEQDVTKNLLQSMQQDSADRDALRQQAKPHGDGHGASPLDNGGPSAIGIHHMPAEEAHAVLQAQTSFTHDAAGGDASFGSIVAVMMDYLKMAQKDARDDHEVARDNNVQALAASDAHLQHDNQAIDQGMEQANEKADIAMHSAWTGMALGIVSGLVQIGSSAAAMGSSDNSHSDQSSSGHDNGGLPHFELVATSDTSHHWPF